MTQTTAPLKLPITTPHRAPDPVGEHADAAPPADVAPPVDVAPPGRTRAVTDGVLVALDIDGTLLGAERTVPDATVAAVQDARRAGHHVVLASGRSLVGILPVVQRLGIDQGWVVASNGAVVVRVGPGLPGGYRLEKLHTFDVEPVIRFARTEIPTVQVGVEEVGWGYRVDRLFERGMVNGRQRRVPDTELWNVPVPRAVLRGVGVRALLDPLHALGVTATPAGPDWVDVTPGGQSKATALERVRMRIGVDPDRTVAVGDGLNDLEMLAWAARGVAMGHAPAAVLDAADEITGTIHEHGVVGVLRTLS